MTRVIVEMLSVFCHHWNKADCTLNQDKSLDVLCVMLALFAGAGSETEANPF